MQILVAPIENHVLEELTTVKTAASIGDTSIVVQNVDGFAAGQFLIFGIIGSETAEIVRISSVSSSTLTLVITPALQHAHDVDDRIQKIRYDKRKFYRSTSKTGTYSHLSSEGSPVAIEVDNPEGTEFEDSTGVSTSWYKATYYNSYDGLESSLDDSAPAQAGDSEHYTSIYKIKDEAGFVDNSYISSETINRYRDEAEAQADSAVYGVYSLPFSSSPKMFQHIITLLAAGLLLSKEYGIEADVEISKTGQRKIERAESLLQKIADGVIVLLDSSGNELSRRTGVMASGSNTYDVDIADSGELFNLNDENFKFTDPSDPTQSSKTTPTKITGFS